MAAFSLIAGTAARAADVSTAPVVDTPKCDWDVAFGVTFTSDYASRGATNTEGHPAVQPFAELTIGKFYAGYWGSNVEYADTGTDWENDLMIGIRPELGPIKFDFGYVQYVYTDNTLASYGEIYTAASWSPVEPVTLGVLNYWDPAHGDDYLEFNGEWKWHDGVSFSAAVASKTVGGETSIPWNVGVSWAPQEWVSFDARYWNGLDYSKVVVGVTFSTALTTLGVIHH